MKNWRRIRPVLFLLALAVVGSQLDDRVVDPALNWFIPAAPVILYNVVVTVFTLMFGVALVLFLWNLIKTTGRLVFSHGLRSDLWNRFQQWPTSKKDVLLVACFTWSAAVLVSSLAILTRLPRPELAANDASNSIAVILLLSGAPILLILPLAIHELYSDVKRQWADSTQGRRVVVSLLLLFVAVANVSLIIGDYAGWDHVLWFNDG